MFLVPGVAPGVRKVRNVPMLGGEEHWGFGHAELYVGYRMEQERMARQGAEAAREAHGAAEKRIRHYAERLLRAQEDERRLLSQDLHDQPLQDLIHLLRLLENGSTAKARKVANDVVSELRQISRGLRPPTLDDLGVGAALHKLVADFQARTEIPATFRIEGDVRRLAPEVEVGLFRIAQEALNNVACHSGAANVVTSLQFTDNEVQLNVSDDGAGFQTGRATAAAPVRGGPLITASEPVPHCSRR